jgi:hypothetical protein
MVMTPRRNAVGGNSNDISRIVKSWLSIGRSSIIEIDDKSLQTKSLPPKLSGIDLSRSIANGTVIRDSTEATHGESTPGATIRAIAGVTLPPIKKSPH